MGDAYSYVLPPMRAGEADDIDIEFAARIAGFDDPGDMYITPDSGNVQAWYRDSDGNRRYWNGSAFVAGPAITLAATIVGDRVTYPYTHRVETIGATVHFKVWLVKNGKSPPAITIQRPVVAEAEYFPDHGD